MRVQTDKAKREIVQSLAKNLEAKVPQNSICIEIVTQLRGRVFSRFICECLDEKYKQKYRVENAKKEKNHKQSLAALALHCPPEWKRKTKPKNEKISFSKQAEEKPQQQIATMQGGKSVIINETSSNRESPDAVNQPHDEAKQNGIGIDGNNEAQMYDISLYEIERLIKSKEAMN